MEVCRYVNADKFINKLDHGLDEEVRERGNNFSAGQRQLLSFARTIIHKPSVMILDEATANIDTETELLIQDSLEKMRTVGTMLIVAHRLSTIQHADNIIVLSHGKILEQGTHQQLLARHGRYYQLYTLQYHKGAAERSRISADRKAADLRWVSGLFRLHRGGVVRFRIVEGTQLTLAKQVHRSYNRIW